jgi:perosamine synthetase
MSAAPRPALLGGPRTVPAGFFPRDRSTASPAAQEAVAVCLTSGAWSMFTSGEVAAFERELAAAVGAEHAILLNSCTTAIHACLLALGVGPKDRVAVPAYTYVGTCLPAAAVGAELVFVDIDPRTQSLAAADLERALDAGPVRAVIQAHLFGAAYGAGAVTRLCRERGIFYIADCAQFIGDREATAGLLVDGPCCFSFGESKTLRIGEGGAVATNSAELADRVRQARHEGEIWLRQGTSRLGGEPPAPRDVLQGLASVRIGLNYRPPALMAALARVQLRELPAALARTEANAQRLLAALAGLPGLTLPAPRNLWWTFPVLVESPFERDVLLAALLAEGIPAGVHFPRLMNEHPTLCQAASNGGSAFPGAELFACGHLVLPVFPALGPEHMDCIAAGVRKVLAADADGRAAMAQPAADLLENARVAELCSGLFIYLET